MSDYISSVVAVEDLGVLENIIKTRSLGLVRSPKHVLSPGTVQYEDGKRRENCRTRRSNTKCNQTLQSKQNQLTRQQMLINLTFGSEQKEKVRKNECLHWKAEKQRNGP